MDIGAVRDKALAIPGTEEADHFGNPSYRAYGPPDAKGKRKKGVLFMTLRIEEHLATLMLTVDQQAELCTRHPDVFSPWPNKWGENGATRVDVRRITERILAPALALAWRNALR